MYSIPRRNDRPKPRKRPEFICLSMYNHRPDCSRHTRIYSVHTTKKPPISCEEVILFDCTYFDSVGFDMRHYLFISDTDDPALESRWNCTGVPMELYVTETRRLRRHKECSQGFAHNGKWLAWLRSLKNPPALPSMVSPGKEKNSIKDKERAIQK